MYKPQGKKGLFDEEFTRERLSSMGNPLEAISKVIDIEMFRISLENNSLLTSAIQGKRTIDKNQKLEHE